MNYSLQLEFFLQATPDEVMELLTNETFINEWSGSKAVFEKKIGGKFIMFDGWVEGEVLKITTDELVYTWKPSNWANDTKPSEVHFKLIPALHGTNVLLAHTNFPNQKEMESHKKGWDEHFFGLIGEYLSNRNL